MTVSFDGTNTKNARGRTLLGLGNTSLLLVLEVGASSVLQLGGESVFLPATRRATRSTLRRSVFLRIVITRAGLGGHAGGNSVVVKVRGRITVCSRLLTRASRGSSNASGGAPVGQPICYANTVLISTHMVFSMGQSVLYAQTAFCYICFQPISLAYILQFMLWTLLWTQPYLSILLVWLFSVACTLHAYFRSIFTDSVIFALELAGVSILIVLCFLSNGYYHPRRCRAELRHPICNIFIIGTRVKVAVLRKS